MKSLRQSVRQSVRLCVALLKSAALLGEAGIGLALASGAIGFLPFRMVVRLAGSPIWAPPPSPAARRAIHARVRWAILFWAGHLPWRILCFQQGLAAQWLLRRRGIAATLQYGAHTTNHRGLSAHVWICDGTVAVIGGEAAAGLPVLARFPPQKSPI